MRIPPIVTALGLSLILAGLATPLRAAEATDAFIARMQALTQLQGRFEQRQFDQSGDPGRPFQRPLPAAATGLLRLGYQ